MNRQANIYVASVIRFLETFANIIIHESCSAKMKFNTKILKIKFIQIFNRFEKYLKSRANEIKIGLHNL